MTGYLHFVGPKNNRAKVKSRNESMKYFSILLMRFRLGKFVKIISFVLLSKNMNHKILINACFISRSEKSKMLINTRYNRDTCLHIIYSTTNT